MSPSGGRTLPLKLKLLSAGRILTDADVAPPVIVSVARNGNALDFLKLWTSMPGEANDNGVAFRFDDGVWVYNLSTKGLSIGTYRITLKLPDGDLVCAGFVLR